jgi:hypothetical protein
MPAGNRKYEWLFLEDVVPEALRNVAASPANLAFWLTLAAVQPVIKHFGLFEMLILRPTLPVKPFRNSLGEASWVGHSLPSNMLAPFATKLGDWIHGRNTRKAKSGDRSSITKWNDRQRKTIRKLNGGRSGNDILSTC